MTGEKEAMKKKDRHWCGLIAFSTFSLRVTDGGSGDNVPPFVRRTWHPHHLVAAVLADEEEAHEGFQDQFVVSVLEHLLPTPKE